MKMQLRPITIGVWIALYGRYKAVMIASNPRFF